MNPGAGHARVIKSWSLGENRERLGLHSCQYGWVLITDPPANIVAPHPYRPPAAPDHHSIAKCFKELAGVVCCTAVTNKVPVIYSKGTNQIVNRKKQTRKINSNSRRLFRVPSFTFSSAAAVRYIWPVTMCVKCFEGFSLST